MYWPLGDAVGAYSFVGTSVGTDEATFVGANVGAVERIGEDVGEDEDGRVLGIEVSGSAVVGDLVGMPFWDSKC